MDYDKRYTKWFILEQDSKVIIMFSNFENIMEPVGIVMDNLELAKHVVYVHNKSITELTSYIGG